MPSHKEKLYKPVQLSRTVKIRKFLVRNLTTNRIAFGCSVLSIASMSLLLTLIPVMKRYHEAPVIKVFERYTHDCFISTVLYGLLSTKLWDMKMHSLVERGCIVTSSVLLIPMLKNRRSLETIYMPLYTIKDIDKRVVLKYTLGISLLIVGNILMTLRNYKDIR